MARPLKRHRQPFGVRHVQIEAAAWDPTPLSDLSGNSTRACEGSVRVSQTEPFSLRDLGSVKSNIGHLEVAADLLILYLKTEAHRDATSLVDQKSFVVRRGLARSAFVCQRWSKRRLGGASSIRGVSSRASWPQPISLCKRPRSIASRGPPRSAKAQPAPVRRPYRCLG